MSEDSLPLSLVNPSLCIIFERQYRAALWDIKMQDVCASVLLHKPNDIQCTHSCICELSNFRLSLSTLNFCGSGRPENFILFYIIYFASLLSTDKLWRSYLAAISRTFAVLSNCPTSIDSPSLSLGLLPPPLSFRIVQPASIRPRSHLGCYHHLRPRRRLVSLHPNHLVSRLVSFTFSNALTRSLAVLSS
jgi:hypothetical protein